MTLIKLEDLKRWRANRIQAGNCNHDDMTALGAFIDNVEKIERITCKECKYDHHCNHSVQRMTSKPDYMSIVYVPIGWCERGER